ncbi:DEAD/DEAH box helicase family protein [Streptomyces avidinii]|uniref:DEAD/DEAH box helicase family protein n=1 Tax=Streptomyces avidinii TaxID=1895 RepID=UPI00378901F6
MRRSEENPDALTFRAALRQLPVLEANGRRLAQIDAITGLEKSLGEDRARALIQMATGAGKTFTAVAQTYRLLKHAKARRVLFLVDRNNLGRQAYDEFRKFTTPDDGRKLSDIYNVDRLGAAGLQDTSSVTICTIQKMYSLLRGEALAEDEQADEAADSEAYEDTYATDQPIDVSYNPDVPIESFDLIIVDECHRSIYGLWRGVLEYFDAHLVGLTATPTLQTLGFFGRNLVSEYTYPQAVADGVNVDFDVVRMRTDLRENGGAKQEPGGHVAGAGLAPRGPGPAFASVSAACVSRRRAWRASSCPGGGPYRWSGRLARLDGPVRRWRGRGGVRAAPPGRRRCTGPPP